MPELLGASLDISTFEFLADDPALVVEAVNRALLSGRMSAAMRQSIKNAVAAVPAYFPKLRAQTALYFVASSSEYQVIK